MLLVGGHPGVGKSTLIRHIYTNIYEKNMRNLNGSSPILLTGKHDQIKHTPYSAIIEALGMMVRQLLSGKAYVNIKIYFCSLCPQ